PSRRGPRATPGGAGPPRRCGGSAPSRPRAARGGRRATARAFRWRGWWSSRPRHTEAREPRRGRAVGERLAGLEERLEVGQHARPPVADQRAREASRLEPVVDDRELDLV